MNRNIVVSATVPTDLEVAIICQPSEHLLIAEDYTPPLA
jgi:hypothetical protein